jgi:hypothetical protein
LLYESYFIMKLEQKFGALRWTHNERRRELWVFKTGQCTRTHFGWTLQAVCDQWMIDIEQWPSCWLDVTVCNFCLWAVSYLMENEFIDTVRKASDRNLTVWGLNVGEVKHFSIQCSGADCTSYGHKNWKFQYYHMLLELILFKNLGW